MSPGGSDLLRRLPKKVGQISVGVDTETSYWTEFEGQLVCVVLSGYIGRIDNYSKRRLGMDPTAG